MTDCHPAVSFYNNCPTTVYITDDCDEMHCSMTGADPQTYADLSFTSLDLQKGKLLVKHNDDLQPQFGPADAQVQWETDQYGATSYGVTNENFSLKPNGLGVELWDWYSSPVNYWALGCEDKSCCDLSWGYVTHSSSPSMSKDKQMGALRVSHIRVTACPSNVGPSADCRDFGAETVVPALPPKTVEPIPKTNKPIPKTLQPDIPSTDFSWLPWAVGGGVVAAVAIGYALTRRKSK